MIEEQNTRKVSVENKGISVFDLSFIVNYNIRQAVNHQQGVRLKMTMYIVNRGQCSMCGFKANTGI